MPIKDAQRRGNGLRRLTLWLRPEVVAKLDEICEESGYSRGEMIETMVEVDHESLVKNRRAFADRKPKA